MNKNHSHAPFNSSILKQYEDIKKRHSVQQRRFYNYLKRHTVSCSMASKSLRIPQKCLTRYKRNLEKAGLLTQVKIARCNITGRYVWYLSTDPQAKPQNVQTKLL